MLVVSDTSPINYLVLIDALDVLPSLFDAICIPSVVIEEMMHQRAPQLVRDWASNPPKWLQIREPAYPTPIKGLDRGETHAIALAIELNADALLVDDRDASKVALAEGLSAVGTLAVLARAIAKNLVKLENVVDRLTQTNFWGPIEKLESMVDEYRSSPG